MKIIPLLLALAIPVRAGEPPNINYDESKVGAYTLPELLLTEDGRPVTDRTLWRTVRRPELIEALSVEVYGRTPVLPVKVRATIVATKANAVDGLATRTLVELRPLEDTEAPKITLMLYVPNGVRSPAPVFLGLNFGGLASIEADPTIPLTDAWMRAGPGVMNNRATEATRGSGASAWPLALALRRGYAVATYYYGDLEPDHRDGWRTGLRGYLLRKEGRAAVASDEWGAIGVWAWGLSRALDYLETNPAVDARRVAVLGHSRQGKTALWAGAQDERFALVISNDSGEGGASLGRRNFGETIADSIRTFPYWYCDNYRQFVGRADTRKTDQHMLLALVAPRALYVASATEDLWADPRGEFLSSMHAAPAYRLFGLDGLGTTNWPAPDRPVGRDIGYHLRTGKHALNAYDWECFLDFADKRFVGLAANAVAAPNTPEIRGVTANPSACEGPIRAHPVNPHYLCYKGSPVLLISSDQRFRAVMNRDFDYVAFFDKLVSKEMNFTRIYPGSYVWFDDRGNSPSPGRQLVPWKRTTVGGAHELLGGFKYDLDQWDEVFFARLHDFCAQARARDIIVMVTLFNGIHKEVWENQPLHAQNNIQGVGTCAFGLVQSLDADPRLLAYQEKYLVELVRRLNEFDNVIYYLCSEPQMSNQPATVWAPWLNRMIDLYRTTEAGLPKKHLVGQAIDQEFYKGPGVTDFTADPRIDFLTTRYLRGLEFLGTKYALNKPFVHHGSVTYSDAVVADNMLYRGDKLLATRAEAWEYLVGGWRPSRGVGRPGPPRRRAAEWRRGR